MRKIGKWKGPQRVAGSTGPYFAYRIDAEVNHTHDDFERGIDYGTAIVTADSTDEHTDQNVNWDVGVNGSPVKRGHARTIRKAKAHALVALRKALGIGHRAGVRYTAWKQRYKGR